MSFDQRNHQVEDDMSSSDEDGSSVSDSTSSVEEMSDRQRDLTDVEMEKLVQLQDLTGIDDLQICRALLGKYEIISVFRFLIIFYREQELGLGSNGERTLEFPRTFHFTAEFRADAPGRGPQRSSRHAATSAPWDTIAYPHWSHRVLMGNVFIHPAFSPHIPYSFRGVRSLSKHFWFVVGQQQ